MMTTTSFQLPKEQLEKIKERAEDGDKSQSKVIRDALEAYLDEEYADIEDQIQGLKEDLEDVQEWRQEDLQEWIQAVNTWLVNFSGSEYRDVGVQTFDPETNPNE